MKPILDPGGEDSDDALVPAGIVETQPLRHLAVSLQLEVAEDLDRLGLHLLFDAAPLAVQIIEPPGNVESVLEVVAEQAADAETHVGQASRRVEPRPDREREIGGDGASRVATADLQQGTQPGAAPAGAYSLEPLLDEHAVVEVERNHVGHRAERDQIQQLPEIGLGHPAALEPVLRAQPRA